MDNSFCIDLDKLVCRFFVTTGCRDGKSCLFPHVNGNGLFPDTVCRYFLKGECIFGKDCRYDHVILWKGNTTKLLGSPDETLKLLSGLPTGDDSTAIMDTDAMSACAIYNAIPNKLKPEKSQDKRLHSVADSVEHPGKDHAEHEHHYHLRISVKSSESKNVNLDLSSRNSGMMGPLKFYFEPCHYKEVCPFLNNVSAMGNKFPQKENEHRFIELNVHKNTDSRWSLVLSDTENKTCGLCGSVILQKERREYCQYGLLQNCQHFFCVECILPSYVRIDRKKLIYYNLNIVCPECNFLSRNVIPSRISMTHVEKQVFVESLTKNRQFYK